MRLTIEIDENDLHEVQRATGDPEKSTAVKTALAAYLHEKRKQVFLASVRSGALDYPLTNDELEAMLEGAAN